MSERGSCVSQYRPVPRIEEESETELTPISQHSKLLYVDFWPQCINSASGLFSQAEFDRFDTLLPRANAWLREHAQIELVKCETLEKKVWSPHQVADTSTVFDDPTETVSLFYLKGLRLWYTEVRQTRRSHAGQVGYRNMLPRCLDVTQRYPVYEELGPMYSTLNEHLIERPLEGEIITMETVCLRLDRTVWDCQSIEPDATFWPMTPKQHFFFFTRIFYLFECPRYEQVGAADFLPDQIEDATNQKSALPRYTNLAAIMSKLNSWLKQVKDIRITNLQTLEAAYPGRPERVRTNVNFICKADTTPLVRFLRVSYARPKFGLPPAGLYVPRMLSQKTFVPSMMTTQCQGRVDAENVESMWEKAKRWVNHVEAPVVSLEVVAHPLPLLINKRDCGESTVTVGEWRPAVEGRKAAHHMMQPTAQALCIRLYLDGDFREPPDHLLAVAGNPETEVINDCCSLL